ncbi:MAG: YciI family protein [Casimicrobiaceae bacterium]
MKFLCLAYYDEKKFDALPKPELDAMVRECKAHDEALQKGGHLMLVGSLAAPRTTSSIRPRGGKPAVTDGPFAETKEQIGAFFIIEARDLEEATQVASRHPAAHLGEHVGWGIEVRPIDYFMQPSTQ